MSAFFAGFLFGAFLIVNISLAWPAMTVPYRKGMIDCKKEPERCEALWQAYQLEQKAEQLARQARKQP